MRSNSDYSPRWSIAALRRTSRSTPAWKRRSRCAFLGRLDDVRQLDRREEHLGLLRIGRQPERADDRRLVSGPQRCRRADVSAISAISTCRSSRSSSWRATTAAQGGRGLRRGAPELRRPRTRHYMAAGGNPLPGRPAHAGADDRDERAGIALRANAGISSTSTSRRTSGTATRFTPSSWTCSTCSTTTRSAR